MNQMLKNVSIKTILFYSVSILFILLNTYFMTKKDSYAINILPFLLAFFLIAIFSFDKLIYLIVFFTPISLPLSKFIYGLGFNMYLPTEPLLFGILLIFLIKIIADRGFDKKILSHPVSIAIFINLFWIFLTSLTSTMPLVSFKFLLSRIWFIVGFYLLMIKIFEKGNKYVRFIWLYIIPLLVVIIYTIYRHFGYGLWDKTAAHFVVNPFFVDHTSYGAILAMYIPFLFLFTFGYYKSNKLKLISFALLGLLIIALILSYSRAAWVSMVIGLCVWLIIKLRIKLRTLFITFFSVLVLFLAFQPQIIMFLERNTEESSSNIFEHISSISNITSDASNLERINRWNSAIRMFKDKPIFGYGPGTYMFKYAPFQLTKDRTIISTNAGDRGNAHSEYLGPLAEEGILGMISFIFIVGMVLFTALRAYSQTNNKKLKGLLLAALIGLITYYVHGAMNNFLDTDKASVPFWGFTALIVSIDIQTRIYLKQKNTM